jgi:hypothetical protein
MTSTEQAARIHRISEGVIATYIHDISTSTALGAPPAPLSERAANSSGAMTRFAPGGSRP